MTPSAGDQWRVVSVLSSLCVQGPSRSESDQGGDRCRGGKWWCGGPSHTRYRLFLHPVSFPLLCLLLLPLRSRADCALWRGGCFACLVQTSERLGSTGTSDATPTVSRPALCVWRRPSAQTNESRPPPQPLLLPPPPCAVPPCHPLSSSAGPGSALRCPPLSLGLARARGK